MARIRQITTSDYDAEARERLAQAVAMARSAAGYNSRAALAKAATVSVRSIEKLEWGEPGVGQRVLFAVARQLPGWVEATPRHILQGGKAPDLPRHQDERLPELRDDNERRLWALDLPDDVKWGYIYQYRARQDQARTAE